MPQNQSMRSSYRRGFKGIAPQLILEAKVVPLRPANAMVTEPSRMGAGFSRYIWGAALLVLATAIGCGEATPAKPSTIPSTPPATPAATASNSAPASTGEPAATASPSIDVTEIDWKQLDDLVASHKGKVVVVDLWSTSCEPCLREFPHLVALQKQHPDDVICVSYDCDFIGARNKPVAYYRERVLKFLESVGANTIVNTMCTVAAEDLFTQINVDSIPAVYVYDRTGKLAKRFDNTTPASPTEEGISYETQIVPLVSELVKAAQN